jgi:polysaccharide export outer membrane protein
MRQTSLALALAFVVAAAGVVGAEGPKPAAGPSSAPAASPSSAPKAPAPAAKPGATATVVGGPIPIDYTIGPGDVVAVSVWKNEALSRTVPVRPDGKISLPLLQDIHAAGLTAMQLRDKIAAALHEFLPNPEISVTLTEVHSFKVSVLGEVLKPGVYEFKSATTVLEAIAMAGGLGPFASGSKIAVIRKDGTGTKKIKFNYHRAVAASTDEDNLVLQPGDVVVIP